MSHIGYPPVSTLPTDRSRSAKPRKIPAALIALLLLPLATGCATTSHGNLVAFLNAHDHAVSNGHYTVMPPDSITIHAPQAPEIDGVTQRLRPDGKLSLRLLGEVHVAGLTTQEIAEKLRTLLARYYVEREVVVEVSDFQSQRYYVFGQVSRAGPKALTGHDTLLMALAEAHPTFLAWTTQIRVVRPDRDKKESKTIIVNLDQMVQSGETNSDILLQDGDIIDVPPTPLAWVGLRIREVLNPFEPAIDAYLLPTSVLYANDVYSGNTSIGGGNTSNGGTRTGINRGGFRR